MNGDPLHYYLKKLYKGWRTHCDHPERGRPGQSRTHITPHGLQLGGTEPSRYPAGEKGGLVPHGGGPYPERMLPGSSLPSSGCDPGLRRSVNSFRMWVTLVLGFRGTCRRSMLGQVTWTFATLGVWRRR